jgi:hypothetical protein
LRIDGSGETRSRRRKGIVYAADSSNPVTPTIFRNQPFGQNVEGLSDGGDKSYVIERAVQKDDFEDSTFCGIAGAKPLLPQGL